MRADSRDGHGLWVGDTRVLSDLRLRFDAESAVARRVRPEAGSLCLDAGAIPRGIKIETA